MNDAYAAGLLDGEGSIMLLGQGKRRSRRPQIAVAMMERHVPEALAVAYGGFISDRGTVPQWRLNGQPALAALRKMRPYLRIERRKALADLLINDELIGRADLKNNPAKIPHNERVFREMQRANAVRRSSPPSYPTSNPSVPDFAYLAGILDGEGHISFDRRRIEVWSTDPELPAWLASKFGGGVYVGRRARGNCRTTWRWLRSATGCAWAARVADLMLLDRKAGELRQMQDFERTPAPAASRLPTPFDAEYKRLRESGVRKAAALRESGIPPARARQLEKTLGL